MLGAGPDQLFLIKTAKKMGIYVYCVDINGPMRAKVANHFFNISSRNLKGLKSLIDELNKTNAPVSGVITMGSDIPHIVAELSEYAGTPSYL